MDKINFKCLLKQCIVFVYSHNRNDVKIIGILNIFYQFDVLKFDFIITFDTNLFSHKWHAPCWSPFVIESKNLSRNIHCHKSRIQNDGKNRKNFQTNFSMTHYRLFPDFHPSSMFEKVHWIS
jgi:hypothetical protein